MCKMAPKYDSLTRRRICSAANCSNSPGKDLNISLFRFPKDQERCRQWIINCQREDLMRKDHICLYNNYRLCSAHFEDNQFYNPRVKNRLIWNSIPTIFMHSIPNFPTLDAVRSYHGLGMEGGQQNMQHRIEEDDENNSQHRFTSIRTAEYGNSEILEEHFHTFNLPIRDETTLQFCHGENERQKVIFGEKGDLYFQALLHSLPENLALRQSSLHTNFYGIWSQEDIPEGTRFGPYGGILTNGSEEKQIAQENNRRKLNETVPNWLEYINHALSKEQQNLIAFQFQEQIFYISSMKIPVNTELLAGYRYEHGCISTSENEFYKASNTYHEPSRYDKCEKTFSLQCYLKLQNIVQTNITLCEYAKKYKMLYATNRYKCGECGKLFTQYEDLKRHKWMHTGVKPYECGDCGKKFAQNYHLKIHRRRLHTGEKPFKCEACGKKYADSSDLRRHKWLHTEENPYKCDICGKKFVQCNSLKSHKIRLHTGEKPYQCDKCEKKFAENRDLRRHVVRLHNEEKRYGCIECGKKFALDADLNCHMKRTHPKERPFKCDLCGKKFVLKYNLNCHKQIHSKDRPYECDECGKTFIQKFALKAHKKIHAGEKPHECEICRKRFMRNTDLNRHKKLHARTKYSQCDEYIQNESLEKQIESYWNEIL